MWINKNLVHQVADQTKVILRCTVNQPSRLLFNSNPPCSFLYTSQNTVIIIVDFNFFFHFVLQSLALISKEIENTVKPVLNGISRDQNIFPLKPGFRLIKVHYIQYKKLYQDMQTLTLRWLMSYIYIYGAPILDVSRSHTTTQHSR